MNEWLQRHSRILTTEEASDLREKLPPAPRARVRRPLHVSVGVGFYEDGSIAKASEGESRRTPDAGGGTSYQSYLPTHQ